MSVSVVPDGGHALHLYMLGGFRVVAGAHKIPAPAARHSRRRERIVDLLWPDQELENPDNSLRQTLYAVRRALAGLGAPAIAPDDAEAARAHLREASSLYERIGDESRAASLQRRLSEGTPQ